MIVGGGTVPATNLTRQDVQRPRPPHVAVISMDAACAPFRIDVAGGSASVRRGAGSRGSVRIVRGTAMPQIGRASCRERVKIAVGASSCDKKAESNARARFGLTQRDAKKFALTTIESD